MGKKQAQQVGIHGAKERDWSKQLVHWRWMIHRLTQRMLGCPLHPCFWSHVLFAFLHPRNCFNSTSCHSCLKACKGKGSYLSFWPKFASPKNLPVFTNFSQSLLLYQWQIILPLHLISAFKCSSVHQVSQSTSCSPKCARFASRTQENMQALFRRFAHPVRYPSVHSQQTRLFLVGYEHRMLFCILSSLQLQRLVFLTHRAGLSPPGPSTHLPIAESSIVCCFPIRFSIESTCFLRRMPSE